LADQFERRRRGTKRIAYLSSSILLVWVSTPTVTERRLLQRNERDGLPAGRFLVDGDDDLSLGFPMRGKPGVEVGLAGHGHRPGFIQRIHGPSLNPPGGLSGDSRASQGAGPTSDLPLVSSGAVGGSHEATKTRCFDDSSCSPAFAGSGHLLASEDRATRG